MAIYEYVFHHFKEEICRGIKKFGIQRILVGEKFFHTVHCVSVSIVSGTGWEVSEDWHLQNINIMLDTWFSFLRGFPKIWFPWSSPEPQNKEKQKQPIKSGKDHNHRRSLLRLLNLPSRPSKCTSPIPLSSVRRWRKLWRTRSPSLWRCINTTSSGNSWATSKRSPCYRGWEAKRNTTSIKVQ